MTLPRIHSIGATGFLGIGSDGVTLDLGGASSVLVGPNNSGKTTIASILPITRMFFDESESLITTTDQNKRLYQVAWLGAPTASADLRHRDQGEKPARLTVVFDVEPDDTNEVHTLRRVLGTTYGGTVKIAVTLELGDKLKRLAEVDLDGMPFLRAEATTKAFEFTQGKHKATVDAAGKIGAVIKGLFSGVVYFTSTRRIAPGATSFTPGKIGDLTTLAQGMGVVEWVKLATAPDPKDSEGVKRRTQLRSFQNELAKFMGVTSLHLTVNSSENTLNVEIDDHLMPLERVGAGIAESIIILLVTMLARQIKPQIHTIVLEEPELHLHPHLQRELIRQVRASGVHLVATTHSPSVLNEFAPPVHKIFRTGWDKTKKRVAVREAVFPADVLAALNEIGAMPSDVLQADKVLWVEGVNDVPVFREWIKKAPHGKDLQIGIFGLGGSNAMGDNFNVEDLVRINPRLAIILDSERAAAGDAVEPKRQGVQDACKKKAIDCLLTNLRNTESYFSPAAVAQVFPKAKVPASLDPYKKLTDQVSGFRKQLGGEVAKHMNWADIENTDVGQALVKFLTT